MKATILPSVASNLGAAPKARKPVARKAEGSLRGLWILTTCLSAVTVGLLALFSMLSSQVGADDLMRDASAKFGTSSFTAFGSDLGMYAWVSALAIGVVSLVVAERRGGADKIHTRYLLSMIGLTLVLFLDDRLMLHEHLQGNLGISELYVMGALMLLAGLFFFCGAKLHHLGGWPLLLTSMALFALSIIFDQISSPASLQERIGEGGFSLHYLIEDGFKLSGIIFWLVFCARAAIQVMERAGHPEANTA